MDKQNTPRLVNIGARLNKLAPLILIALIALGLNLRSPLTTIAPVTTQLRDSLHISSTVAGLLTSIPILCFGVLTPMPSAVIARLGIEKAVMLTLLATMLGTLIRPAGGILIAMIGTLILSVALTIGNRQLCDPHGRAGRNS